MKYYRIKIKMARGEDDPMGNNNRAGALKKIIIGLALCVVTVCMLAGILLLLTSGNQSTRTNTMDLKLSGNGTVTEDQLLSAKNVLEKRFDALNYNVSITPTSGGPRNRGLTVNYDNISLAKMASIATTPGLVDLRIQTSGNESQHVLYSDEIMSASIPVSGTDIDGLGAREISIRLTSSGARGLQQACIQYGATTDPLNHSISLLLDGKAFYSAPLSHQLASEIVGQPVDFLSISTGSGDNGKNMAELVTACLQGGVLPLRIEIVNNGNGTV
jgi:preprotein translocase subunit SecD